MLEQARLASEHEQAHIRIGDGLAMAECVEASEMQVENSGRNHRTCGRSMYIFYNEAFLRRILLCEF
jgi:hypothetical protein